LRSYTVSSALTPRARHTAFKRFFARTMSCVAVTWLRTAARSALRRRGALITRLVHERVRIISASRNASLASLLVPRGASGCTTTSSSTCACSTSYSHWLCAPSSMHNRLIPAIPCSALTSVCACVSMTSSSSFRPVALSTTIVQV
jgi:hypothetical protein